jgi:hypothetical protein
VSLFVRCTGQADLDPRRGSWSSSPPPTTRGTRYQMAVRDFGGGIDAWTLMLGPSPPHDRQWLELITAPGQPP